MSGSPQAFTGLASSNRSQKSEDFEEAEDGMLLYGSLGIIPRQAINIIGATTSSRFVCKGA